MKNPINKRILILVSTSLLLIASGCQIHESQETENRVSIEIAPENINKKDDAVTADKGTLLEKPEVKNEGYVVKPYKNGLPIEVAGTPDKEYMKKAMERVNFEDGAISYDGKEIAIDPYGQNNRLLLTIEDKGENKYGFINESGVVKIPPIYSGTKSWGSITGSNS